MLTTGIGILPQKVPWRGVLPMKSSALPMTVKDDITPQRQPKVQTTSRIHTPWVRLDETKGQTSAINQYMDCAACNEHTDSDSDWYRIDTYI